jgi:hypothetical protein
VKYEGLSPAVREKDGEASHGMADIPHELYATLAEAPQASIRHVVGLYHQVLLEHGLVQEAERIMRKLGEFQSAIDSVEVERELQGMDLLLKNGLLKWLLAISPLLPAIPTQVGLCLYIVLHTPHKLALEFYHLLESLKILLNWVFSICLHQHLNLKFEQLFLKITWHDLCVPLPLLFPWIMKFQIWFGLYSIWLLLHICISSLNNFLKTSPVMI